MSKNNEDYPNVVPIVPLRDDEDYYHLIDSTEELKKLLKASSKYDENDDKRTTFLLERELSERIDKLSSRKRGYKNQFFNAAVKKMLDELEE